MLSWAHSCECILHKKWGGEGKGMGEKRRKEERSGEEEGKREGSGGEGRGREETGGRGGGSEGSKDRQARNCPTSEE